MFGVKVDPSKLFFDKPAVVGAMDRATVRVFNRFGATTRLIARRSIRKASKNGAASKPGQPPRSRTGLLREHIYYSYNKSVKSVVTGPALFARSSWAQKTLEYGGTLRKKNPRRRIREVGDGGEIRLDGRESRTTKTVAGIGGDQRVTYGHLATQTQADRANRLNEQLYGPTEIVATIAPRPYMQPAFEKAKEKLPEFWENAITT